MCSGCTAVKPQPSGTYIFPATETMKVTLQSNNVPKRGVSQVQCSVHDFDTSAIRKLHVSKFFFELQNVSNIANS